MQSTWQAFADSTPPPHLTYAALDFSHSTPHAAAAQAMDTAALAAVTWLVHAPMLSQLKWSTHSTGHGNPSSAVLAALASLPKLQHVLIGNHHSRRVVLSAEEQDVVHQLCAGGLVVRVLDA